MLEQHRQVYKEEAYELLTKLESELLELEENPLDQELVASVFRAMHTIKGSGAMFGFDDIAAFTHEVETAFDNVREGKVPVTKRLVDLSLSACDMIRQMVDGMEVDQALKEDMLQSFKELILPGDIGPDIQTPPKEKTLSETKTTCTYRIRFRPSPAIFATGTNPLLLLDELRGLGDANLTGRFAGLPPLSDLNVEMCYLFWDIVLTTSHGINAIKDVFIFVEDNCDITIDVIDGEEVFDDVTNYKRLGEILVERGDVSEGHVQKALGAQRRLGELLVEEKAIDGNAVASALTEQEHVNRLRKDRREDAAASSIRVPAERLDALVDLVGEMVTVQARLSQKSAFQDDPELLSIAEEVERLTAELRDNTMSIRMLPIGETFARFKRLLRDLAKELGKEVALETEGGETELDKTVIERLNDPLVHLIRNSIDHGIESPDKRKIAGKPIQGTVRLTAAHMGANVVISIEDDGSGLDPELIRAKAIERGLIAADANLTEGEIFAQIFAPGFSTAEKVTDVSGRGVGMDVVKRSIDSLRGTIDINSKKGIGTIITLKLPLTLAIIDGLLVELDKAFYVLPLSTVEGCVELTREDVAESHGRNLLNVRGNIVPYIPLRDMFGIKKVPPDIEHIVIAEVEGHRFGVVVDQVIGGHQTVIKTLGKAYKNATGFSGATILADGTVALILDVHKLNEIAASEEIRRNKEVFH